MKLTKLSIPNAPSIPFIGAIRANPRAIFAIGLLVLSLLAAITITEQANRSVLVWSAKGDLVAGEVLTGNEITKTKVMLPQNSLRYLGASAKIIGSTLLRRVGAGELIPTAALSLSGKALGMRSVPFRIAKNDLPNDLANGQIVDLYALPIKELNSATSQLSQLVAHGVSVESIDIKARDIGGEIGIVLRISEKSVLSILDLTATARVVVVRSEI